MPSYPDPNGGSMQVANRAEAEARGWTPSMGTFGINSDPGSGGGSSGGGGASAPQAPASNAQNLGALAQNMLGALASGNKAAFDEAVREFNQNYGLDQQKFQASVDQFNKNFGMSQAALTGTYEGAPTLAAQQQTAGLSGMYNGAPTEAARQFNITAQQAGQSEQDKTAQGYLTLLSGLRGPNDPFQYLRTLRGTPSGISDVVNAAAGRYQLGGTPSGEVSQRATIGGQIGNMNGAQSNSTDPNLQGLPPASQIDPRAYNQMDPSQQSALWAAYEYGGPNGAMRPEDAQYAYKMSLPTYGGPRMGSSRLFSA